MKPLTCLIIVPPLAFSAPLQAGLEDLRITEVDPANDRVEVTHFADTTFTTASSRPFCHLLNYSSSILAGTEFGPRESKVFTVVGLNDGASDIWLFRSSTFGSPTAILTGITYGAGNLGRTGVAVNAGIWPSTNDFVPTSEANETLRLTGTESTDPDSWESLPPQLGEFFELVDDPFEPLGTRPTAIGLQRVADGLTAPVGVVDPDDGSGRLFIYEQQGVIHILRDGAVESEPFLDIEARTLSDMPGFDERGLIGFALHPDFADNGLIYTHTSEEIAGNPDFTVEADTVNHHGVVAEWQVDAENPDRIDPGSRRELLRLVQPQFNHDGGELLFGPQGYLHIGLGDGGGRNDNEDGHGERGNGQDPQTPLGSILRIDPAGSDSANGQYGIPDDNPFVGDPGALDEIFAYGFRNPFRISYDPIHSRILVADVGQDQIEEINVLQRGGNFGWRLKEGTFFFNPATAQIGTGAPFEPLPATPLIDPLAQYDHSEGLAIVGGFIYRGSLLPEFRGHYLFGDFGTSFAEPTGALMAMAPDGTISRLQLGLSGRELGQWVKGFGQDAEGELYLCSSSSLAPSGSQGVVWRLIPLVTINGVTQIPGEGLRIEVLADEDGGTVSLRRSSDLTSFFESVPLSSPAPSRFEALVPLDEPRGFFRARLDSGSP